MEENENQNPEQFNNSGKPKKKKGLGFFKGLLLFLVIAVIICAVGLLIRMVVADDGDYLLPIRQLFGLEEENDDDDKEESKTKKTSKSAKNSSSLKSAQRYTLLSDDAEDSDVKHYRLTIDVKEFFELMMEELEDTDLLSSDYDYEDYDYDWDDEDYDYDWNDEDYDFDLDDYDFEDYDYDWDEDYTGSDDLSSMLGLGMMLLEEMGDMIDGEMYFDIYFEGNEIVQVVIGYDYAKFLENLYDYMLEEDEESLEDEGIESLDDFADYLVEQFEEVLDEDAIYDMIMDSSDEDVEAALAELGIKEKDIKEAFDFYVDKGIMEVYINGTTKLKALLSMGLESESFRKELEEMEEETGVEVDEDNIIESIIEALNSSEELEDYGMEFVEVK